MPENDASRPGERGTAPRISDLRYGNRDEYRSLVHDDELRYFRMTCGETDLQLGVSAAAVPTPGALEELRRAARDAAVAARRLVKDEIAREPAFLSSLVPLPVPAGAPPLIRRMYEAALVAGTGPMAAVAGAIAEAVGTELAELPERLALGGAGELPAASLCVLVENGGDLFIRGPRPFTVAIAAGKSPLSMKLGLRVAAPDGFGVCTSSGTYGHSLSFGRADAAVVLAKDPSLADAAATMLGNKCKISGDLPAAVEWAAALPGVSGAVAVLGETLAAAGEIEFVRL